MELKDKVAFITGGTKGIGLGIAKKLLENGVKVAISGRKNNEIQKVVKSLSDQFGSRIIGIEADVRNFEQQEQAVDKIKAKFGPIDILIANAGLGYFASIEELSLDQWNETLDINLTGVFYSVKACLHSIIERKGYIITIASLAGTNFFEKGSAYVASKFGLVGFTQSIMLDLRKHGVKVTTIMPGSVSTNFNNNQPSVKDNWKIQPADIGKLTIDILKMHPRSLPSKIEIRPSQPPSKK